MAEKIVTLIDGLKIGETVHRQAVLRDPKAGELIDAMDASEKPVTLPKGGIVLVLSETRMGLEVLRRQIVRIGDHKGPLDMAELRALSGADLSLLQAAASELDTASTAAMARELATRGRCQGDGA
jgi:phage FluMu protein gp41